MSTLNFKTIASSTATMAVVLGIGAIAAAPASAASFGSSFDNNHPLCDGNPDCSLQNLLDGITVSGPGVDTVNDQTGFELFTNTATGNVTASFMFEVAGFKDYNSFGIYNPNGDMITIYDGSNDPGDSSFLSFLGGGDVSVTTKKLPPGASGGLADNLYTGFGNKFGFYVTNKIGETFYTEKSRNGGFEQAVVYQGDNQTVMELPGKQPGTFTDNEFIIAFEDLWLGDSTDSDYNDLVVMVESVEPIPEPATLAGLGLVGATMLLFRGRKNQKNS